jgi:hypothetical protein
MKTATFSTRRFLAGSFVALSFSVFSTGLFAQPVVDFTVTGTSGDYTLDFTVNNATPGTGNQDIYVFGVYDPIGTVSGSPSGYTPMSFQPLPFFGVGTSLTYNDSWYNASASALGLGTILSGFDVLDTSVTAPTSIPYFAVGFDGGALYTGPGNLAPNKPANPLFEGNAVLGGNPNARAADDGSTMILLALSMGVIGGVFHKLQKLRKA